MADPWFTATLLRDAAGAKQAFDQEKFELAAKVACREVRRQCGPVFPVETITQRIRVRVPSDGLPLKYRPAALTSITTAFGGAVLTITDYDFDEQLLIRKDGGLICESLTVVYTAGYVTAEDIPDELVSMATLIGQQYLRVVKRFSLNGEDDTSQTGFLVPSAALDVGRDYLLAPEGIG